MMDDARINLLLEEFIDGEISTDDLAALQEVLAERPEIRRRYFEALAVDHLLEEAFGLPDYCGMRSRMFAESERARSMRKRWLRWSTPGRISEVFPYATRTRATCPWTRSRSAPCSTCARKYQKLSAGTKPFGEDRRFSTGGEWCSRPFSLLTP